MIDYAAWWGSRRHRDGCSCYTRDFNFCYLGGCRMYFVDLMRKVSLACGIIHMAVHSTTLLETASQFVHLPCCCWLTAVTLYVTSSILLTSFFFFFVTWHHGSWSSPKPSPAWLQPPSYLPVLQQVDSLVGCLFSPLSPCLKSKHWQFIWTDQLNLSTGTQASPVPFLFLDLVLSLF